MARGSDVNITEVAVNDRLYYCFFSDYVTGLCCLHQGSDCHDHFGRGEERNLQQGYVHDSSRHIRYPSAMTTLDSIVEYLLQLPVDVVLYLWIESSYPPRYCIQ